MIDNERFSKLKAISDPFPILVIENFLTKEEAEDGYKILTNSNFDEFVNDGRFNIRKRFIE